MDYSPFIISWNTTRRCNLRCAHCYLDARELEQGGENELTTAEGLELIDSIAALSGRAFLVLTGGEPLLREDILELASHASSKGLLTVLGTNGTLLNAPLVEELKKCGLKGLGITLHSLQPDVHDSFTGLEGSLSGAMEGVNACRRAGLEFQIQTVATRHNLQEVPAIIAYAQEMGARAFNLFFLICTGRGQDLSDLSAEEYEGALSLLLDEHTKRDTDMMIRARCAPHFKRIARQKRPHDFLVGSEMSGCLAATHYCRITPEGDVTPCPYMPLVAGNVRKDGFQEVWRNSDLFQTLRSAALKGKCGRCEFAEICGGCRARAYAMKGDPMEEDPWCLYQPSGEGGKPVKEEGEPRWTPEAEEMLSKIPFFIRDSVRKGVVAYAKKGGVSLITPDVLTKLKSKVRPH